MLLMTMMIVMVTMAEIVFRYCTIITIPKATILIMMTLMKFFFGSNCVPRLCRGDVQARLWVRPRDAGDLGGDHDDDGGGDVGEDREMQISGG